MVLRKAITEIGLPEPHIESLVLVAPQARIDRPKNFDTSSVVKADQFMKALEKSLEDGSLFSAISGLVKTKMCNSVSDIANKLIALHRPVSVDYAAKFGLASSLPPAISIECRELQHSKEVTFTQRDVETPQCRECGTMNLSIQYGRYGYYFKCNDCSSNMPLKVTCGQNAHKAKIRKEGLKFYRECADCGTSNLYFTNPH